MKRLVMIFVLATLLFSLLTIQSTVYASQENEVPEEILTAAKEADLFFKMLYTDYHDSGSVFIRFYHDYRLDHDFQQSPIGYSEVVSFILEKGYYAPPDDYINVVALWQERYGFPFSQKMNSLETWQKEVLKYFSEDFLFLAVPQPAYPPNTSIYIHEENGKTYAWHYSDFYVIPEWETAELTKYTGQKAEIRIKWHDDCEPEYIHGTATIPLEKTENGWRVCKGGTYFEGCASDYPREAPTVDTGDNTALFVILALSGAALACAALSLARKKRKEN